MYRSIKTLTRRNLLRFTAGMGIAAGLNNFLPAYAREALSVSQTKTGQPYPDTIDLEIDEPTLKIAGRTARPVTVNNSIPGPLIRLREGQDVTLRVTNRLKEDTSIHWHGILLPDNMDGVPGVSFRGIKPGETFTYRFPVKQNGTYWYHSHSGMQEQLGLYGPLIIDPAQPDPVKFDREYVMVLSDWMFENPKKALANLKKMSGYYNFQRLTGLDALRSAEWNRMRMDPTDIADITGGTYTYLMNGLAPDSNWTGLFQPGERVRLRFINASAMTYFDIRIPGLKLTVVQADGQNVQPVTVDEFRIAIAETYDVIVQPTEDAAYTVFAETMARDGYARGTLATRQGMTAPIPERRQRPVRSMEDMGMDPNMPGMNMDGGKTPQTMPGMNMDGGKTPQTMPGMNHNMPGTNMDGSSTPSNAMPGMNMDGSKKPQTMPGMNHNMPGMNMDGGKTPQTMPGMNHTMPGMNMDGSSTPSNTMPGMNMDGGGTKSSDMPGMNMNSGGNAMSDMAAVPHGPDTHGPGNSSTPMMTRSRLNEPGVGLENTGTRVLVYTDLRSLSLRDDQRKPERDIELHLTGNMDRYMWSFDGKKYSQAKEPISLRLGERLRLTFVNDTMMEHPIHLHGMWMELDNGSGAYNPRKHTVNVKPAERLSVNVTVDAPGEWAFHCHLLFHMETGMFRKIAVSDRATGVNS